MVELTEEEKILPPGQPGIETLIASSVIAESAPDRARIFCRVVAGDKRLPACGQKKRCQNSQNRRFSGAIRAQKRDSFAFRDFERHALQRRTRRAFEGLKKRAYTAARWRVKLFQIFQDDGCGWRGFLHRVFIAFPALEYKP